MYLNAIYYGEKRPIYNIVISQGIKAFNLYRPDQPPMKTVSRNVTRKRTKAFTTIDDKSPRMYNFTNIRQKILIQVQNLSQELA